MNDTWEWDGRAWTLAASTGPLRRNNAAMAFDQKRKVMVLFGGDDGNGVGLYDTWEWDGKKWREVSKGGPPATTNPRIAYDKKRGVMVLFIPPVLPEKPSETWEWDGKTWRKRMVGTVWSSSGHELVYDERRGRVILVCGKWGNLASTGVWEWDGMAWRRVALLGPQPRSDFAIAYDSHNGRVILYGGVFGQTNFSDLWAYEWLGAPMAGYIPLGGGCPGSNRKKPILLPVTLPKLASVFELAVKGAPPMIPGVLFMGGFKFHFDLGSYGAPGCFIVASPDVGWAGSTNGAGGWVATPRFQIPGDYCLLGGKVYLQALFLDPKANVLGAALSDAGEAVLGF